MASEHIYVYEWGEYTIHITNHTIHNGYWVFHSFTVFLVFFLLFVDLNLAGTYY